MTASRALAKCATGFAAPSPRYSVTRFLLDVTLARLLLTLTTLLTPFRGLVSLNLFLGRSLWQLARDLERALLRLVGWLAARPRLAALRHLGPLDARRWHYAAAGLALYSGLAAGLRAWQLLTDEAHQQKRRLLARMTLSRSYFEWSINATKLDALEGVDQQERWRQETKMYDRQLLREKVLHLRKVKAGGSITEQMFAVRADLLRNLGHMTNSALHQHFPVVPEAIREYIEEVKAHLEQIARSPELPLDERAAFLKETRHAFGRTALVLSGGGPLAAFHMGVVRALAEHGLLPRVLAGSGTGALVAALLATRSDAELQEVLGGLEGFDLSFLCGPATAPQLLARLVPWGGGPSEAAAQDSLLKRLRHLLGDLTFLEAFRHTGRVLNVCVPAAAAGGCAGSSKGGHSSPEPPRLLNYLTAPHVIIWSAVACSSAFPGLMQPCELLARNSHHELVPLATEAAWGGTNGSAAAAGRHQRQAAEGGEAEELPMRALREMFSVNHFIMSQTSPALVPLINAKLRAGWVGAVAEAELKHRCRQLEQLLPPWLPAGQRWLRRFGGPWEGDVTIVPPHSLLMPLQKGLLAAPSRADLLAAVRQGELCTWAKLSAIQCNCGIEATLDACIQQVTAMERQQQRQAAGALHPLKARIPSWMHLPTLQQQQQQLLGAAAAHGSTGMLKCGSVDSLGGSSYEAGGSVAGGAAAVGWGASGAGAVEDRWWVGADGFYFDAAEDHLPLPEERPHKRAPASPPKPAFKAEATFDCTDSSQVGITLSSCSCWGPGSSSSGSSSAADARVTLQTAGLSAAADREAGTGALDVIAP